MVQQDTIPKKVYWIHDVDSFDHWTHTYYLTQPMDPEKKSLNFIFPTKYVIPKSLKFSHWPSKLLTVYIYI